jgi:Uridylate kinase
MSGDDHPHPHPHTSLVLGAQHIASRLMAESLMDRRVLGKTEQQPLIRMLPGVNVVKVGGQSILDRGRTALLPALQELADNLDHHKIIITVGESTRARHAFAIASDLSLPTGVMSVMGDVISNQNALIVTTIMMQYGGVRMSEDHFDMFPIYLNAGCPIVLSGMTPYRWFEMPSEIGRVPEHRSDCGTYLIAEVFGCQSVTLVKDVDGLYSDNPKTNPSAEFIPRIGVNELIERKLPDLPVEPALLDMMRHAKLIKEIRLVNGLERGNITRALHGEAVGSVIYQD